MKKYIILLAFFVSFHCLYSQSSKFIAEYHAKDIHVALRNNVGIELAKVLFGTNVSVTYDTVYSIFEITFQNREGGMDTMKLFPYSEGVSAGDTFLIMKDDLGNTYNVFGNIEKYGTLVIFFNNKTKEGNTTLLSIQGAKRVQSNKTDPSEMAYNQGRKSK